MALSSLYNRGKATVDQPQANIPRPRVDAQEEFRRALEQAQTPIARRSMPRDIPGLPEVSSTRPASFLDAIGLTGGAEAGSVSAHANGSSPETLGLLAQVEMYNLSGRLLDAFSESSGSEKNDLSLGSISDLPGVGDLIQWIQSVWSNEQGSNPGLLAGQTLAKPALDAAKSQTDPVPDLPLPEDEGNPVLSLRDMDLGTRQDPGLVDTDAIGLMAWTPPKATLGPEHIESIIEQTAKQYGLDPHLVRAVVKTESNFNPKAVSRAGAMGLMQLMPSTARDLGVNDAFDPVQNVAGGVRYLKQMLDRYSGNVNRALAAYNWGPGNLEKSTGSMPRETRSYIRIVNHYYSQYKKGGASVSV